MQVSEAVERSLRPRDCRRQRSCPASCAAGRRGEYARGAIEVTSAAKVLSLRSCRKSWNRSTPSPARMNRLCASRSIGPLDDNPPRSEHPLFSAWWRECTFREITMSARARSPASIVVSLSSGSICRLEGETSFEVTSTWHAHDFEPWIAAFDCWEPTTVWTGGDDLTLKGWDLRQGCDRPTFVNKRTCVASCVSILQVRGTEYHAPTPALKVASPLYKVIRRARTCLLSAGESAFSSLRSSSKD